MNRSTSILPWLELLAGLLILVDQYLLEGLALPEVLENPYFPEALVDQ